MIGIDANVLLRWLTRDFGNLEQSALAIKALRDADADIYVNAVVLAETFWVLKSVMRVARKDQADTLRRILEHPRIVLSERAQVKVALSAFELGGPGFSDQFIGALNTAAGCRTTLTFDKAAAKGPRFTQLS